MKLYTAKTIALRCSLCGALGYHTISPFSFSGGKAVSINCECGYRKARLGTKDYRQYWLQVPCVVCETEHRFVYPAPELWTASLTEICCPGTGLGLGYLGNLSEVRTAAAAWDENGATGFDAYFVNPPVMYEIVRLLQALAGAEQLTCLCGSREIEVDLYPERLELYCRHCQSRSIIYAETAEDLKVMRDVQRIEMTPHGFACIDATNLRSLRRRKPIPNQEG